MAIARTFTPSFPSPAEAVWTKLIPEDQWEHFVAGADALHEAEVPFLLAGAMALASYTGRWRNTKDVDVIIRAEHRTKAVEALRGAGFDDYFDQQGYDRSWIFRGFRGGVLFDVIWDLPNHRVQIDDAWFERATPVGLHGQIFHAAPAEDIIRVKLYVMQRERCDWVDVLNVLAATVERIDWRWLVERMGRDLALLHGALAIFNWMSPARAKALPEWLRAQFALGDNTATDLAAMEERRTRLFDSRPWFALHQPDDRPLER